MSPLTGESYDAFYKRLHTEEKISYGMYEDTLLVSFGKVPGNGIKYVDLFGGQTKFEAIIDEFVTSKKISSIQGSFMKKLYGNTGPTNGEVIAYNDAFSTNVLGGTGVYSNTAKLQWDSGSEDSNEIKTEFEGITGGADAVKVGNLLIKKIDGDTNSPLKDAKFQLLKKDNTGQYKIYTPIDGIEQRITDEKGQILFENLTEGEYKIVEVSKPNGYSDKIEFSPSDEFTISTKDTTGIFITAKNFKEKTAISGIKTWSDDNDKAGKRPKSIVINLLADGKIVDSKTITAKNKWKYSFNNLNREENGVEINYSVTENSVDHYSTTISGFDITNTYTQGKTSATVTKTWSDDNDKAGKRPDSIKVQLYGNEKRVGKIVTLSAKNNWTHSWQDLDIKRKGTSIKYVVKELEIPTNYNVKINNSDKGNIILTNSYNKSDKYSSNKKSKTNTGVLPKTGIMDNLWLLIIGFLLLGVCLRLIFKSKIKI